MQIHPKKGKFVIFLISEGPHKLINYKREVVDNYIKILLQKLFRIQNLVNSTLNYRRTRTVDHFEFLFIAILLSSRITFLVLTKREDTWIC
jgi:hypothetical protein